MTKRDLFSELLEGIDALQQARSAQPALPAGAPDCRSATRITAAEVRGIRTRLALSEAALARHLHVEARTIASWEQGRAQPNAQAAILLKLLEKRPQLLAEIACL